MKEASPHASTSVAQLDFSGGVQEYVAPYQLKMNEYVQGIDVCTRRGRLEKRKGYDKIVSSPETKATRLASIVRCYGGANGTQLFVVADNGEHYYLNGSTLTSLSGNLYSGTHTFAVWKQTLYMTADSGYKKWDLNPASAPVPITTSGTRPDSVCKYLLLWRQANRLVAAGSVDSTKESIVYFSDLGLPETWLNNDFTHIPENMTGDRVMGLANMPGGELLILGERTITLFYGRVRSDFTQRTVDYTHGCSAPYSVCETDLGVFFKSKDGFYIYAGGPGAEKVSYAIDDIVADMVDDEMVAETIDDRRVMISYKKDSDSTVNDRTLIYNLPTSAGSQGTWDGPFTYGLNGISYWNGEGDAGEIYALDPGADLQLFQVEQGYDDGGDGYGIDFISREFLVDLDPQMQLQDLLVSAEVSDGTTMEVGIKVDGQPWEYLDPILMSKRGPYEGDRDRTFADRYRIDAPKLLETLKIHTGRTVQIRLKGSASKNNQVVRGFRMTAKDRTR
jgi:hypothetical protein